MAGKTASAYGDDFAAYHGISLYGCFEKILGYGQHFSEISVKLAGIPFLVGRDALYLKAQFLPNVKSTIFVILLV